MKAAQTFTILVDGKGNRVVSKGKELIIKKGSDVLDKYVSDLVQNQPHFLEISYVEGRPAFSKEEIKRFNLGNNPDVVVLKEKAREDVPEVKKKRGRKRKSDG